MLKRVMAELVATFTQVLEQHGELSLRVRPEAILFEDEVVLEEPNPDESIPFAFYRDGIRRIDLSQGLEDREIEVLTDATAEGFGYSGLGDDIVSYLWRHDLEHVRYVVVDTTIVQSDGKEPDEEQRYEAVDLDRQIEGLLTSIYGADSQDDVGPKSVRVDGSDLSAKKIAETLEAVDEMAPGFHPARALPEPPIYAAELRAELEEDDDVRVTVRAAHEAFHAMCEGLAPDALDAMTEVILRIYDAALVSQNLSLAGPIIRSVRSLGTVDRLSSRAEMWIKEALSEARLRNIQIPPGSEGDEAFQPIATFFEAGGSYAVPALLSLIPAVQEHTRRRQLSDLAVKLGIEDLEPLRAMLESEQPVVPVEAIHMLARIDKPEARVALLNIREHADPGFRIALLEAAASLSKNDQLQLATMLLEDQSLDVRCAAAKLLGNVKDIRSVRLIEGKVKGADLLTAPFPLKQALLHCYVALVQVKAIPMLTKMLQDGGGLLARRDAEELAIAASQCLGFLATPGATAALKKAGSSFNMKVRGAAEEALKRGRVKA